jgi:transposase
MGAQRTDMHRLQELVRYHRLGRSARDIARLLGMGRDTIRGYAALLGEAGLLEGDAGELPALDALAEAVKAHMPPPATPPQRRSTVEAHRGEVERLRAKGAQPTAIHDWLRLHVEGYTGTVSAIKRMCQRLAREEEVKPEAIAIAVETAPGEVAQVDFGYAGLRYDPAQKVMRRAWLFLMTLGFSRHQFADLVFDQRAETWLRLHVAAFEFFGGAPRVIVPDNLKAAVVRAAFGAEREATLNRSYCELARHYGIQIDPTPPRDPKKKGKVERNVKYVRSSFLATNEPVDLETDRRALRRWLMEVAGQRRHGTTGRAPLELFEEQEREALLALPAERFSLVVWKSTQVHRDTHVQVEGAFYSVPWRHVTRPAQVRVERDRISIFVGDELVASHAPVARGQRSTVAAHLPEHRGELRHRSQAYWMDRAAAWIGQEAKLLVEEIFAQDDVLHQLRRVQAVVGLLEGYPRERAERAARRARRYACFEYRGIKNILVQALDFMPLPDEQLEIPWMQGARFARRPTGTYGKEAAHDTEG